MLKLLNRQPLVSCLLVTADGRTECLRRSLRSYFDQTYPHRELVIVNEGPTSYQEVIRELVKDRDDVRCVFLNGDYTLGGLRNISVGLAHGDIFVQWDDDDFSVPDRIALQLRTLLRRPEARLCYLSDQLHYYFDQKKLFWDDWAAYGSGGNKNFSLIPGTLMAWKEGFKFKYPSSGDLARAGEDSVLAESVLKADARIVHLLADHGHMHVYSYHGKNVWDAEHHMKISTLRSRPVAYLRSRRADLVKTIDYLQLPGVTTVMGRDGVAFSHEAAQ